MINDMTSEKVIYTIGSGRRTGEEFFEILTFFLRFLFYTMI